MPRITDSEESLEAAAAAAKAAGARAFWAQPLFLKDCARQVFLPWLEREFPALLSKYRTWYGRQAYLRGPYVEMVKARVEMLRRRHGLEERMGDCRPPDWRGPAQLRLLFACQEKVLDGELSHEFPAASRD